MGDEDFVGSDRSDTINTDSYYEEAHLVGPTIKELFGDLDKSIPKTGCYNCVMDGN